MVKDEAEARAKVAELGLLPVAQPGVEAPEWWYVPVQEIGTLGVVVDKATGQCTRMSSALSIDDNLWAYSNRLYEGQFADLSVVCVGDVVAAAGVLRELSLVRYGALRQPEHILTREEHELLLKEQPVLYRNQNLFFRARDLRSVPASILSFEVLPDSGPEYPMDAFRVALAPDALVTIANLTISVIDRMRSLVAASDLDVVVFEEWYAQAKAVASDERALRRAASRLGRIPRRIVPKGARTTLGGLGVRVVVGTIPELEDGNVGLEPWSIDRFLEALYAWPPR